MELSKRDLLSIGKALEALLTGVAVGVLVYATVQIAPACLKNYEFEQAMRKEVQLAAINSRPANAISDDVWEKGRDLGIPVDREGITVTSSKEPVAIPIAGVEAIVASGDQNDLPSAGDVSIDVSYSVPIPFPGHTFRWKFHFRADNHSA
jgi:hypothetical protein